MDGTKCPVTGIELRFKCLSWSLVSEASAGSITSAKLFIPNAIWTGDPLTMTCVPTPPKLPVGEVSNDFSHLRASTLTVYNNLKTDSPISLP